MGYLTELRRQKIVVNIFTAKSGIFSFKARKLKVAESNQAKACLTKPRLATNEAKRLAGRLRAICPTLVGFVLLIAPNW